MELSMQKAEEVAKTCEKQEEPILLIGADTVVAYGDEILGKPKDETDAYRMLSMLQGTSHKVYTGVTLLLQKDGQKQVSSFFEETDVAMYPMGEREILWYIETKEPFDKAGGYGIQGRCARFVKEIRGDYNNVVGLPVARIYQEIKKNPALYCYL